MVKITTPPALSSARLLTASPDILLCCSRYYNSSSGGFGGFDASVSHLSLRGTGPNYRRPARKHVGRLFMSRLWIHFNVNNVCITMAHSFIRLDYLEIMR